MSEDHVSLLWSRRFGLARSPMFELNDGAIPGIHNVMLDGGHGSFGLSVVEDTLDPREAAGWVWSCNLPHHVAVTESEVQVVRWDAVDSGQPIPLSRVQQDVGAFYRYLCKDRLRSNRTVIQYLIETFGRVRSLAAHVQIPDERSIDAFVTLLGDLISVDEASANPESLGLPQDAADLRNTLSSSPAYQELVHEMLSSPAALTRLPLSPILAIRHAGGEIFQEAHFDLVRASPPDLFWHVGSADAEKNTRGGIHFTPPALARTIVDQALRQIADLKHRHSITICDPACGSGAFLHEAIRGLRRAEFNGSLIIIGNDVSAAAITMAKFTLKLALRDWQPSGEVRLRLAVEDSLHEHQFPSADVILMNPPFISAIAQTDEQKAQLRRIVGQSAASRGDYSMAFVQRALESIPDGGIIGTLFPASLLTHTAATTWRERLASLGNIRLLARIGDYGMFSHALVHVAFAIIQKSENRASEFTALITENDSAATGDALRELRRFDALPPDKTIRGARWSLFATSSDSLRNRVWRILSPEERSIIDALDSAQTTVVRDLFEISQGVQTGYRKALLLDEPKYKRLPSDERIYFREALMTDSISNGRVVRVYYLFFPHAEGSPIFDSEAALAQSVPTFYRDFLKPNESALRERATIRRSGRTDWWGLMHPRKFSYNSLPRIISKFFGSEGSFVCDLNAAYLPSTGHVWIPKADVCYAHDSPDVEEEIRHIVLRAYTALLNSRIFMRLVSLRSIVVAGGQFDLSSRFLAPIYLPNLWEQIDSTFHGDSVRELSEVTASLLDGKPEHHADVDQLVAQLYGVSQLVGWR